MLVWKLDEVMFRNKITVQRLAKETGLHPSTVSELKNGKTLTISFQRLEQLLETLERLSGKKLQVTDLLEYTSEDK